MRNITDPALEPSGKKGVDKRMVGMLSLGDISHASSRRLTGELARAISAHHL